VIAQTVLRAADGTRWVVSTHAVDDGFLTTARRTGCDLRPRASIASPDRAAARLTHDRLRQAIERTGQAVITLEK
jgi:hypothetical protein